MLAQFANKPALRHAFSVVIDYGVMGALAKNGAWTRMDMALHVQSYPKLLAPDGVLFLKWDFTLARYAKPQLVNFAEELAAAARAPCPRDRTPEPRRGR